MRLNLGCGFNRREGYLNVDCDPRCQPDQVVNLERTPWPWADDSADAVLMVHVLEHLGETTERYFAILRELYRVCRHDARITIVVPHPRHDDFLHDATHVRAITLEGLSMFSRRNCEQWTAERKANTPLAFVVGVDFEIEETELTLEEPWQSRFRLKAVSDVDLLLAIRQYNNVVKETKAILRVVKP